MHPYIRKVKTASGAKAVQIVEKRRGVRRISADPAGGTAGSVDAVVVGSASQLLWEVLADTYAGLRFDTIGDEVSGRWYWHGHRADLEAGRDRVLDEIGVEPPHRNTFAAALKRRIKRDYRNTSLERIVNEREVDSLPYVKSGFISRDSALGFFGQFFPRQEQSPAVAIEQRVNQVVAANP